MQIYHSQTYGDLNLKQVREKISAFMKKKGENRYQVIIGSDSQCKNNQKETDFVIAIIVHRIGGGGIYFWRRTIDKRKKALKQRIFEEAFMSLTTAQEVMDEFKKNGILKFDFEIHVDMGHNGATREWINEVVGIIRNNGFVVKTKPYAYGASKVADRHT